MNTIVKTTYITLAGALMLSSCAQEETLPVDVPNDSDRRIVFHTSLPEMTARATEIASNLSFLYMTVFDESDINLIHDGKLSEYIACVRIDKNAGSAGYISDKCVWPAPGQECDILHFYSFYPALNEGAALVNLTSVDESGESKSIGYGIGDFKVATDIADQVDFVTAYANGSMKDNLFSGISLNFRHQLSRIEVKAKGTHKSGVIHIAGVRIANASMSGNFEFQTSDGDGVWKETSPGIAEYIYRKGDAVVTTGDSDVSIMGSRLEGGEDNCAMLIPGSYSAWDYASDRRNSKKGMYIEVLIRIMDRNILDKNKNPIQQQYPYYDDRQGKNWKNIPVVYLAVDKDTGVVSTRLYKNNDNYFTDEDCTAAYTLPSAEEVREFGWAAVPLDAEWEPGHTYTYTLDYSSGVGLHGPETEGDSEPKAGDPVISDKVGIIGTVTDWKSSTTTLTPSGS